MIVFDIETGALPWDELEKIVPPFDAEAAVPHPGEFDPASVAVGNLKDPVKIAEKVKQAADKHALQLQTLSPRRTLAHHVYIDQQQAKAALSACTGRVVAIGTLTDSEDANEATIWTGDERTMIGKFWYMFDSGVATTFVGHNIYGFDLPFLIRRSWVLGVDIPKSVRNGRNWSSQFIDTMERWGCGQREYVKLDSIAKALGIPGKPDDCDGASFAAMFEAGGEQREKAVKYLINDLAMTRSVAVAMGIL